MKSFFKNLFDYNHQCNTKLAQSFHGNLPMVSDESVRLFSHILNAHEIWNARIQGRENRYGVWDLLNPSDFESINETNLENSYSIIESLSLEEVVQHPKSRLQKRSDVLFHVINHSTYHRGQIAMDFRRNEIEPIATDYFLYVK